MANRQKGFGMTAELNKKKAAKFDARLASEAMEWIAGVLGHGNHESVCKENEVTEMCQVVTPLKNGVALCQVINTIKPGSVKKINTSTMAFKQMENIGCFLRACEELGVAKGDLFQTVDLFESDNVPQVINGIFALGRKAQTIGFDGPTLGTTEATENVREFTQEQLDEGKNVIGLQMGSNKGASQAGQNFGKTRAIID